jgi:hypothetical protein
MAYLHDQAVLAGRLKDRGALRPGPVLDGDLAPLFDADLDWCIKAANTFLKRRVAPIVTIREVALAPCPT